MKQDKASISGALRIWITDIKGVKRLVLDEHNAIQADYAAAIAAEMDTNIGQDYQMDGLFDGNTNLGAGNNGESGIALLDSGGGLWYEMDMDANRRSNAWSIFTGNFTLAGGVNLANSNSLILGWSWANATTDFDVMIAKAGSFPVGGITVGAGETLNVEWTIKHS